jgi:hypothetical protein
MAFNARRSTTGGGVNSLLLTQEIIATPPQWQRSISTILKKAQSLSAPAANNDHGSANRQEAYALAAKRIGICRVR